MWKGDMNDRDSSTVKKNGKQKLKSLACMVELIM